MEYYDTIASGYDELHRKEQLRKYSLIKRHLEIRKGDMLLDVGCGTGISSQIFKCRIVGIDPSLGMLKEMKKNTEKAGFVQGEAEHLPFEDKSFDVVLCVTAIHNIERPRKTLEEIKRVCMRSGAVSILKKAKKAEELLRAVNDIFPIEKIVDEEKDRILFFEVI